MFANLSRQYRPKVDREPLTKRWRGHPELSQVDSPTDRGANGPDLGLTIDPRSWRGGVMISPEHLEQIKNTARACYDGGCQPTPKLMLAFRALGRKLDYQVASKHCESDFGEWLYDMSWSKSEGGFFASQPLVIESEISNCDPGVDPDLHKLIQARADVRIWIATVNPAQSVEQHVELCRQQIKRFAGTRPEDFYIFVIFKPNNEPAYFKCFEARQIA